ncbi:HDIG domain-containing protein [Candidatus Daviesbacteria bacterium]|nr:HDIG domain-containing protein [Candidatus Daviesbacteria bacterium]
MVYQLPIKVKNIMNQFIQKGFQIYIVGGAIRDLLMGKNIKDWDFTTDASPEQILKIFPEGFYDNKFGTVGLLVNKEIFEITTMRKEGIYKDFRHPIKVSWTNKVEEDLARRDFTINAIALGTPSKHLPVKDMKTPSTHLEGETLGIIDPFQGEPDIKNRIIRAVGNPDLRFQEDALRLIRAIRIATQLEFEIEKATKNAIVQNVTLINNIANERIRDELFKILASDNSYQGITLLREVGLLQIILPELEKCFGIIQQGSKHARIYDIGEHSLLTLRYTPSKNPLVRLSALLHDIGKPKTYQVTDDGNATFYNHDVMGGNLVLKIAKKFNLPKKQSDKLFKLIRFHMFTVSEYQTDSAIRRFIRNVGLENIDDMMALRIGDRLGGGTQKETSWRMEKFQQRIKQVMQKPFSVTDLKVDGNDVMQILKINPCPKVGEILQELFEEVLKDDSKNNRDYLLQRIKAFS